MLYLRAYAESINTSFFYFDHACFGFLQQIQEN
jgi:hypothetical protein